MSDRLEATSPRDEHRHQRFHGYCSHGCYTTEEPASEGGMAFTPEHPDEIEWTLDGTVMMTDKLRRSWQLLTCYSLVCMLLIAATVAVATAGFMGQQLLPYGPIALGLAVSGGLSFRRARAHSRFIQSQAKD